MSAKDALREFKPICLETAPLIGAKRFNLF